MSKIIRPQKLRLTDKQKQIEMERDVRMRKSCRENFGGDLNRVVNAVRFTQQMGMVSPGVKEEESE